MRFILCLVMSSIFLSEAATALTLRFPLLEEITVEKNNKKEYVQVPLAHRNQTLKKANVSFPNYVEFSKPADAHEKLQSIDESIKKAKSFLKADINFTLQSRLSVYASDKLENRLCYTKSARVSQKGKAKELAISIQGYAGILFSEMMGVKAARYREAMWLSEDVANEDQENWPSQWVDWDIGRRDQDTILILTTDGDGGDELFAAEIPHCR